MIDLVSTQTTPFGASAEHARLARLAGEWRGRAKTFLQPGAPPDESEWKASASPILGGRYLRLEYEGTVQGDPHGGQLLWGYDRAEQQHVASWVDSFHTGSCPMHSTGPAGQALAVAGSYFAAPGQPRWGWRTELDDATPDAFVLRMWNVTPDGKADLGVEVRFERRLVKKPTIEKPRAARTPSKRLKPAIAPPAAKKKSARVAKTSSRKSARTKRSK